ncbi:MAG: cytochrome d ubiquinol oxidase subunit II [Anaerolineales bacterium]|nr:cytochrome d ubiquinol oxidase subunit II [Anaerolineales bacterium]
MTLNDLWFILVAVLYTGFFILEGFDFGVGILLPFLGKNDNQRRAIINTIGPHWDGNEVWLITAGGATFAAFPHWYATLFSGFYLPLFLLLVALILRGIAFEFRSKDDNPLWRSLWDWCIFGGSLVAALLLGVAFANIIKGVPIDAEMHYVGGFFNLLNLYGLLAGVTAILIFALHGAIFLSMKTSDDLRETAHTTAHRLWLPAVIAAILLAVATFFYTNILETLGAASFFTPILAIVALLGSGYFLRRASNGRAFALTCATILFALITFFAGLFPRVMVSSLDPAWSLTIQNTASSQNTLQTMTVVALIFVPIVLLYQGWSYWVFRKRVKADPKTLVY